jgi:hypothetical protein
MLKQSIGDTSAMSMNQPINLMFNAKNGSMNISLELGIDAMARYFTTLCFEEQVDVTKLDKLLLTKYVLKSSAEAGGDEQWVKWFDSQRQMLAKLRAAVDKASGTLPVQYKFAHGNKDQYGRVYPDKHLSFGEVSGKLRAYLLGDLWTALDFANCHPSIMHQALVAAGHSQFKSLAKYCSDRDRLLQEVMTHNNVNRDAAKNLFIRLLYLGTFNAWAKDNNLTNNKPSALASLACAFYSLRV